MATTDFDWARIPIGPNGDIPVKNTDSSNDLVVGNVVTIDASNPMSATQQAPGVKLGANNDFAFGVVVEAIARNAYGRVQILGIAPVVASAAITAGAVIQAAASGKVVTQSSGQPQLGQALTAAAANNDIIMARIAIAKNA